MREIAGWLAAFLAVRLFVLFTQFDKLHRVDELYAGAALLEMIGGRSQGLARGAFDAYSAGSLLVSLGAWPAFAVLGPTFFALKTVALVTSSLVLVLTMLLAHRLFGSRSMRLAGLLMVAAPVEYVKLNLMAWGNHAESVVLSLGALLALVMLRGGRGGFDADAGDSQTTRRELVIAFVCGALATGAVFLALTALIVVATVGAVVVVLGTRSSRRAPWVALAVGAAVGALPWLAMNVALRFHGFQEIGGALRPRFGPALAKLVDLIFAQVPRYLSPHLGLPKALESVFGGVTLLAFAYACIVAIRGTRPGRVDGTFVLVVPPILFAIAYAVSGFGIPPMEVGVITYHYLPPVTPFLLIGLALPVARAGRWAWPLAMLLVAPHLASMLRVAPEMSALPLRMSGASYFCYGWNLPSVYRGDLARQLEVARAIPEPERRRAAIDGIAVGFMIDDRLKEWLREPESRLDRLESFLDRTRVAGDDQSAFVVRLSLALGSATGRMGLDDDELTRLIDRLRVRPRAEAGPLVRAALLDWDATTKPSPARVEARVGALPDALRSDGFEALGMIASRRSAEGRGGVARPTESQARARYDEGLAFDQAWLALTSGTPAQQLNHEGGDREATRRGVERALKLFDADDEVRRQHLAQELGLVAR